MPEIMNFLSNHPLMTNIMLAVFILLVAIELWRLKRREQSLSPQAVIQMINHQQAVLIDIRSPDAFQQGHIISALSMPPKDLQPTPKTLEKNKNKPFIFIDNSGMDASKIALIFKKQGYQAHTLKGGMRAWVDAGMPIVRK